MDAIAVTIGASGSYVGVAPLGTSLTSEQAAQLGRLGVDPIVATDADLAGQVAAERDSSTSTPPHKGRTHQTRRRALPRSASSLRPLAPVRRAATADPPQWEPAT